jgi:N-succinyldiaminopimelate aminotransferase
LGQLLAGITPQASLSAVNLSIGEPKHPTPELVRNALTAALDGLSSYPPTAGSPLLRQALADWLKRRFQLASLNPNSQVLPVNGSREALFALAQTILNPNMAEHEPAQRPVMICPNPFYQIYEGAALLAGAEPFYLPQLPANAFRCDWGSVPESIWQRTALLFVCSPGNPTGSIIGLQEWAKLFELSRRYDFVIASDECYSEIYTDEASPPIGALQAAEQLGLRDFRNLIVFGSLSKRSNCPGMRSGYAAGDANIIKAFLLYRTYHGSAMSMTVQAASIAAWSDEAHVISNRQAYREKFDALTPRLAKVLTTSRPEAGFYLWAKVPGNDDQRFVRELYRKYNVLLLPGSYLARQTESGNPAAGYVRIALVEPLPLCLAGAARIEQFVAEYR